MSIESQKTADAYARPERTIYSETHEPRTMTAPMRGAAHADVKHENYGMRGTFVAAMHYANEGVKRRDELMAKMAAKKDADDATEAAEE